MAEIWTLLREERLRLATALEPLTPEQWAAQSQCEDWTVRDVVAHVAMTPYLRPPRVLPAMIRHRFDIPRLLSALARGDRRSPAQLIRALCDIADDRHTPPKAHGENVLADIVLHAQDVFRPLRIEYASQEQAQLVAAELLSTSDFNCGSATRSQGLRLLATDLSWTHGDGAEVRGPLLALLQAIGGRGSALADLAGEGVSALAERCPRIPNNVDPVLACPGPLPSRRQA